MKVIAVAFVFLMAGISALPNQQPKQLESAIRSGEPRLVTGNIIKAIEDLAQSIANAGLDPFIIDKMELDYAAPVPSVFIARAHIHGLKSRGLSNIVVNRMNYAVVTSRLTFNIELPLISLLVDDCAWNVKMLTGNLNGALSGSLTVKNIVITGNIRVSVGIISGISIRDMELTSSLGGIDSNLKLRIQGKDLSAHLNDFLGHRVHHAIKAYERELNEMLTMIARELAEAIL